MKPDTTNHGAPIATEAKPLRTYGTIPNKYPAFAVVRVGREVSFAERVNDDAALEAVKTRAATLPGATVETATVAEVTAKYAFGKQLDALMFMTSLLSSLPRTLARASSATRRATSAYGPFFMGPSSPPIVDWGKEPFPPFDGGKIVVLDFETEGLKPYPKDPFATMFGGTPTKPIYGTQRLPEGLFSGLTTRRGCGNDSCPNCQNNPMEDGAPFEAVKALMPKGCFFLVEAKPNTTRATALYSHVLPSRDAALKAARAKPDPQPGNSYVILKGTGEF